MNIFHFAVKEIKHTIRDVRTFIFMLAFPIVLMLILGTALSNAFDQKISVNNITVLYKVTAGPPIADSFEKFVSQVEKDGVHFKKAAVTSAEGKKEVQENNATAYAEVTQNGIQLYGSDRNSIEESIVQGMLQAYADKFNMVSAVASVNPAKVNNVLMSGAKNDFIQETSLQGKKQPGSMDYYAVAMSTMIALYGAISASALIRKERVQNTALRLVAAPVKKSEIFLGKILGCLIINALCTLIVVAFSHYVYKANWGDHPGVVLVVLLTEVFLAVSFGLGISYMAKTGEASRLIIMIVIQLASFIGGAYFKIDHATGVLNIIMNLSPLTWVNQAINKIIFMNDLGAAFPVIGLNLGIAALFLAIATISFQRREGL